MVRDDVTKAVQSPVELGAAGTAPSEAEKAEIGGPEIALAGPETASPAAPAAMEGEAEASAARRSAAE